MGIPRPHPPVKLIIGVLASSPNLFEPAARFCEERFGPIELESDTFRFDFTDYYAPEMGREIKRRFWSFRDLIAPDELAAIKLATNALEERIAKEIASEFPRPVNLDPGYVTLSKLVLATTKDYAHRIYLGDGIYAEVTLSYRGGEFVPMEWTYPDYRTEAYRRFFGEVRKMYLAQYRQSARPSSVT